MLNPEILTLDEVAQYLRVSQRTVYDWANKRLIPCGKIGTTWRFKRSEIDNWVDQKLAGRPAAAQRSFAGLRDVLSLERIRLLDTESKSEALETLLGLLAKAPEVRDPRELARVMYEREALMSTGMGSGLAVPHVRLASVDDLVVAVGVARGGIADYATLDGQPVRIICMIAAHEHQHADYLRMLAALSALLKETEVRGQLLAAADPATVFEVLTQTTGVAPSSEQA
ncbi:MAG: PTS sugar transporter subunit IIA [Candidatus Hydrogenedentes bacterium]|nr:PTS sugar transporter subunit IIA [Candidatus Hydrogenedentota bacterium]MBI3119260.1 PTS sugar transporter subunit IIA [Candidatus Hydrogenedentota bacterium]